MTRVKFRRAPGALAAMAALAFISTLLLVLLPTPSFAEYVGVFTMVEGRVDILRPTAEAAAPVREGDGVAVGDFVRTKSDGKAEIVFRDKTVLDIAPGTRIRIDDYTFSPNDTREQGVISLFRGKVRSVVSKIKSVVVPAAVGTSSYKVKTPTTVMGVKGTDVFVYHKRGVTGVVFREGHGFVYNSGIPGRVVDLGAGQMTYVRDTDTPPALPKHVSEVELTTHLDDTTPSMDNSGGGDDGRQARNKDEDEDSGVYGYSDDDRDHVASGYGYEDDHDGYEDYEDIDGYGNHDDYEDHYDEDRHHDDDDDEYVPYTESHDETLDDDDHESGHRDWDFSGASDTSLALNGSAMGEAAGRPFSYRGDLDDTATPGVRTWGIQTAGKYSGVDVTGGAVDVSSLYNDDGRLIVGTHSRDTNWSGGAISGGSTFGYGADAPHTWISVGDVAGTFSSADAAFTMVQSGTTIETNTFLTMVRTAEGLAKLDSLNVPYVEVGRTSVSGTDGNLAVNMNDITFFAYSSGAAPRIWATGDVNGTFSAVPGPGTTVNLTGGGLAAEFTTERWDNGKWTSTVNGSGTVGGAAVDMEGGAAGNYNSGSFTGSGSGVVK